MNQFGETPRIYVWPTGHDEGQRFPDYFNESLSLALKSAGIEWEWA